MQIELKLRSAYKPDLEVSRSSSEKKENLREMFIFIAFTLTSAFELENALGRATGRRYSQLTKMMRFYNDQFDERKYWTYGCNCLMLGDRPLSQPGIGPPVDELDTG